MDHHRRRLARQRTAHIGTKHGGGLFSLRISAFLCVSAVNRLSAHTYRRGAEERRDTQRRNSKIRHNPYALSFAPLRLCVRMTASPRFTPRVNAAEPPFTAISRNPALPQMAKSSEPEFSP